MRRFYDGEESEQRGAAAEIVWHVPGHNPVSGVYRGATEYFDLMPAKMVPLDCWEFALQDVMVNGNYVIATFHLNGERRGQSVDLVGGHPPQYRRVNRRRVWLQ